MFIVRRIKGRRVLSNVSMCPDERKPTRFITCTLYNISVTRTWTTYTGLQSST